MVGNMRPINCIAALDRSFGIEKNEVMPWSLNKEFNHFKKVSSTVLYSSVYSFFARGEGGGI